MIYDQLKICVKYFATRINIQSLENLAIHNQVAPLVVDDLRFLLYDSINRAQKLFVQIPATSNIYMHPVHERLKLFELRKEFNCFVISSKSLKKLKR